MDALQEVSQLTGQDVPEILAMIHELAAYENATSSVEATEEKLLNTLSFAGGPSSSQPTLGFARTLIITDPTSKRVAGMALYFNNYSTWRAAPGIYLEDLFVRPEHRKKGYGTQLLRELAKEVLRMGGGRLEWSCLKWNKPSLDFYESLGAKQMEEWMPLRVDGEALKKLADS